jgi:hypothetical protein
MGLLFACGDRECPPRVKTARGDTVPERTV